MHIAYICIRARKTTKNVLAFAAECGEAKDNKHRNISQLLLKSIPSL